MKSKCNSGKKATNSKDLDKRLKIPPENEPFVWLMLARGCSLQATADAYTRQFGIEVSKSGIQKHRDSNKENYAKFRTDWYDDVKSEPIANSRARIIELWDMAQKLRDRILEILEMIPKHWRDLNVASLIGQFANLIEQIRDECGDKAKSGQEGDRGGQVIQIFNTIPGMYADGDSGNESTENSTTGRGLRMDRI